MTNFKFWDDPYLSSLNTSILSVEENHIILKDTICYAEAGGQERDQGKINNLEILDAKLDPKKQFITYTVAEGHPLKLSTPITIEIDWKRRYRLMRLHFACELVLVLMNRHFGRKKQGEELLPREIDHLGIEKVGARMSEDKARVDFRFGENISQFFPMILFEFETIVGADFPIETGYIDREKRHRYWKIEGLATVPCGGTHVRSTKEIGTIHLKRKRANKGVERIYIYLNDIE